MLQGICLDETRTFSQDIMKKLVRKHVKQDPRKKNLRLLKMCKKEMDRYSLVNSITDVKYMFSTDKVEARER